MKHKMHGSTPKGHVGGIRRHKVMAGAKSMHTGAKMGTSHTTKKMGRSMKKMGSRGGY